MRNKYSNNEVKEEFGTLSFNHVLLYKKDHYCPDFIRTVVV